MEVLHEKHDDLEFHTSQMGAQYLNGFTYLSGIDILSLHIGATTRSEAAQ